MPNSNNVSGGHKANLNNPNTSEESKQHSREVLEGQADESSHTSRSSNNKSSGGSKVDTEGKNPGNVAGGLKATLNNPNVSDEAKESAQQRLDSMNQ